MGVATLGSHRFRLDPTSVSWDFTIKSVDHKTVGGKVVQVYGAELGDMVVTGSFGKGGWEEQTKFLADMKALGDAMVADAGVRNSSAQPMRFVYPPKKWDFLVYLKAYTSPDGQFSVTYAPEIINPGWTLTLFIVEDNSGLHKVAQDVYIARLAQGLGWHQTKYNGPMTAQEAEAAMNGQSTKEYLLSQYGVGGFTPAGNQDGGG